MGGNPNVFSKYSLCNNPADLLACLIASLRVSAMWTCKANFHSCRLTFLLCCSAESSAAFQKSLRFEAKLSERLANDSTPVPCLPANISPDGDCEAATAIGKCGVLYDVNG